MVGAFGEVQVIDWGLAKVLSSEGAAAPRRPDGTPGSLNRAHHHPHMHDWEPRKRVFDRALSSDPVGWVGTMLSDLEGLLDEAGIEIDETLAADADKLRGVVPDVQRAVSSMLDQVKAGQLGTAPAAGELSSVRASWL